MERFRNIVEWLVVILGALAFVGVLAFGATGMIWGVLLLPLLVATAIWVVLWIFKPRPMVQKTRMSGDMEMNDDYVSPSSGY